MIHYNTYFDYEAMETEKLKNTLSKAVKEASFDLQVTEFSRSGDSCTQPRQNLPATQFRERFLEENGRFVKLYAYTKVPDKIMEQLVETLRVTLIEYVNSDMGKIGHAFTADCTEESFTTHHPNGLVDRGYHSPIRDFTRLFVRVAAIIGINETMTLLDGWKSGKPLELEMYSILNGLYLEEPLTIDQNIKVYPLALNPTELPRLPTYHFPRDYLGLSLLKIKLSSSPALFYPDPEKRIIAKTFYKPGANNINVDILCNALSLESNSYVSPAFSWYEYPETTGFSLGTPSIWSTSKNRLEPRQFKKVTWDIAGNETNTPADASQHMDNNRLKQIIKSLGEIDGKLLTGVDRWHRAKRYWISLGDSYIDLRIALEAMYLRDFDEDRSQEMRFRLPLFGAWHLAEDIEERRTIRKSLRAAYDMASKVVHGGKVYEEENAANYYRAKADLDQALELCRRGLLKFLCEGSPNDWTGLVLGGSSHTKR